MSKKIKFIWDFYGCDSKKTANHSLIHLQDFLNDNDINICSKGVSKENDNHFYSYLVLENEYLKFIKDKLKPNRAFYV